MKRLIDILGSAFGLIALGPLLLTCAILIRFKMGSPVFFCQERAGLNGKSFRMIKFRTMTTPTTLNGTIVPDEERVTRLGAILRRTSIDEIPELWNVLKGDMSLVGPRPLLMRYLPRYSDEQARRHEVRPGLTGWAQINGRNAISWEQKFQLDVWYVDNFDVILDIKIIWLTALKILKREGIYAQGETIMAEFQGLEPTKSNDT